MAPRLSTGLRNYLQNSGSVKKFLAGSILQIYSGAQPADADTAPAGSLLNTITLASGAHTPEVVATGTVTLTGGASGTVDTITVNSVSILPAAVSFNSTLTQTAADVVTAINAGFSSPQYAASSSGAIITIYGEPSAGAAPNTFAVACGSTTITNSTTAMASGVTAVNGLSWGAPSAGVLSKSGVWSGVAIASDTPGWFRIVRSAADAAGASAVLLRLDGSVSTSNADLNINPNVSVNGVTLTIDTFSINVPAA